jgi:hypothetical protein
MYQTHTPLWNDTSKYALTIDAKAKKAVSGGTNVLYLTIQITKGYIQTMAFFGL